MNGFDIIIEDFVEQVRSGRVGTGTEFIPGPVNLHELSGINTQAGGGQVIQDIKCSGQKPLFPVLFKLADDIFDVIFVDQEVAFHYILKPLPFMKAVQDLLLVMERSL